MTTYVLFIAMSVAITGYPSLNDCEAAAQKVRFVSTLCMPMNQGGTVVIAK